VSLPAGVWLDRATLARESSLTCNCKYPGRD